jgi:hypothetical protein
VTKLELGMILSKENKKDESRRKLSHYNYDSHCAEDDK